MNYDKLVDLIVQEVYKKLQEGGKSTAKNKTAVIIGKCDLKAAGKALEGCYNVVAYDEDIEADTIVVSELTIKAMANLATLTGTNDEENFIIKSLMEGKKVYILKDGIEYRKYKQTAPKALYNKYLDFEKELKLYGVNVIEHISSCMESDLNLKQETAVEASSIEDLRLCEAELNLELRNKKLISEADIRKPFKNGMKFLIIDKKSILTPLANDFIRIHNLKVKRA